MFFMSGLALLERKDLLHLIAQFEVLTVGAITQRQTKMAGQRMARLGSQLAGVLQKKWGNEDTAQALHKLDVWATEVQSWERQFQQTELNYASATDDNLRQHLLEKSADRLGIKLLDRFWKPSDLAQSIIIELATLKGIECRGLSVEQIEEKLLLDIIDHMLERIKNQLEQCSSDQMAQIAEHLDTKLKTLTSKDREALYRELGLEDQHSAELVQIFRRGTLGLGVFSLLNSAGMGFFVAMSTVIHALSTTLLGIVLPFSLYAGLSSMGAFFLSFPGMVLCGVGMGSWHWKKQSQELKMFLGSSVILTCRSRCS